MFRVQRALHLEMCPACFNTKHGTAVHSWDRIGLGVDFTVTRRITTFLPVFVGFGLGTIISLTFGVKPS